MKEIPMANPVNRKSIDCRDFPGSNCSLKISGTEEEVLKAGLQHGSSVHGYEDNTEFRDKLRGILKDDQENMKDQKGRQVA